MKILLAICMIVAATLVSAAGKPAPVAPASTVVKGEVLEVLEAGSYVYLRLKTKDGEAWAAINKSPVSKGAQVTVEIATEMKNFKSTALNRTFPVVYFGYLAGTAPGGSDMAMPHTSAAAPTDVPDVLIPKATGANAATVAEIVTKRAALKDKPVVVRGKIVKYNSAIMGKNWIHLRDGSGSAADNTNDILVTTANAAKVGDIVTAKGIVRIDKDFGAGYSYKVLIEDATLEQQ
jgi:hypothetical protein